MKKMMFFLVLLLLTSSASFAAPSPWAKSIVELGISQGFVPENIQSDYQEKITREEFSGLIVGLYEALTRESVEITIENPFLDTDSHAVLAAHQLGIVNGKREGYFEPNQTISRQEIAVMFERTLKALEIEPVVNMMYVAFNDEADIATWAQNAVQLLYKLELLGGVGENRIDPLGTASREQAIAITVRTHQSFKSEVKSKNIAQVIELKHTADPKSPSTYEAFGNELVSFKIEYSEKRNWWLLKSNFLTGYSSWHNMPLVFESKRSRNGEILHHSFNVITRYSSTDSFQPNSESSIDFSEKLNFEMNVYLLDYFFEKNSNIIPSDAPITLMKIEDFEAAKSKILKQEKALIDSGNSIAKYIYKPGFIDTETSEKMIRVMYNKLNCNPDALTSGAQRYEKGKFDEDPKFILLEPSNSRSFSGSSNEIKIYKSNDHYSTLIVLLNESYEPVEYIVIMD